MFSGKYFQFTFGMLVVAFGAAFLLMLVAGGLSNGQEAVTLHDILTHVAAAF